MVETSAARPRDDGARGARDTLVARVIAVIEGLVEAGEPVGPRALARRAGVDRSAVGRILRQLHDAGVVERDKDGYVAAGRLYTLGRAIAAMDDLTKAATPILRALAERFDETCYIALRKGDTGVLFQQVESTKPVRYVVELGRPYPLYAGASGLAILSALPDEEFAAYLARTTLEPLTSLTVCDKDELRGRIQGGRRLGYFTTEGERVEGGFAAAAPFFAEDGTCHGAMVLTLPLSRLDRSRIPEYGAAVADAARGLTARLGHRPEHGPGGRTGSRTSRSITATT